MKSHARAPVTRRDRVRRIGGMVALAMLVSACLKHNSVWIVPEAPEGHLIIGIGWKKHKEAAGATRALRVWRCELVQREADRTMWTIGSYTHRMPSRVEYGVVPPGIDERFKALPLTAGIYGVLADGNGIAHFRVDSVGRIEPTTRTTCLAAIHSAPSDGGG